MGEMMARRTAAWLAMVAMPVLTWILAAEAREGSERVGGPMPVEAVVTTGFAAGGAIITAYLTLVSVAMVVSAPLSGTRGFHATGRFAPASWRRVAATALGATLVSGLSVPALANDDSTSPIDWTADVAVAVTAATVEPPSSSSNAEGPEPPEAPTPPSVIEVFAPSPAHHATQSTELVATVHSAGIESPGAALEVPIQRTVARGDSLWSITASLLGADASMAEIADAWPHLYAANEEIIGADPGLIFAGQVLTVPESLR